MRRTTLRLTKAKIKRGRKYQRYYCVIVPKPGRGRTRHFFEFSREGKQAAETFLELSKAQQINYGNAAFSMTDSLRTEAMDCVNRLSEGGHRLTEAVDFFLAHLKAEKSSISVKAAIDQLIANRSNAGLSKRYCGDLRLRLGRFAKDFGDRTIASITAAQLDRWLATLPVGRGTRNTFRRDLRTLWSYCENYNYCTSNEAKKTKLAKHIGPPTEILTVEQAASLLTACTDDVLPYIAISLFAGLRVEEVQKLDWKQIDLEEGHIEVTAANAKTAKRRLVPISDNLAEWLRPVAKFSGAVTPNGLRKRFDAVKRSAGFGRPGTETDDEKRAGLKLIRWPQNSMRHSYGSYRLAQCHDVARVALEMGNSQQIVFSHYRELVKPKDAERYWQIAPVTDAKKVIDLTAARKTA